MLDKHHRIIPLSILLVAASACDRLPLSLGYGVDDVLNDDGSASAGSGGRGGAGEPLSCLDQFDECGVVIGDPDICLDRLSRCDGTGIPAGTGGSSAGTTGTGGFAGAGGSSAGTTGTGGFAGSGAPGEDCNATYQLCLESGEDPSVCLEVAAQCEHDNRAPDGTAGTGGYGGGFAGAGGGTAGTAGYGGSFAGAGGGTAGTGAGGGSSNNECYATYLLCLDSDETTPTCLDDLGRCQTGLPFDGNAGTGAGGSSD